MADAPPPPPPPPPPAPPPSSPTRQPQPPAAPRAGPAAPRQKPKKLSTAAKRASDARKSGDAKRQSGGRKSGERQSLGKSGELLKGPALAISKLGRRLSVRRDGRNRRPRRVEKRGGGASEERSGEQRAAGPHIPISDTKCTRSHV